MGVSSIVIVLLRCQLQAGRAAVYQGGGCDLELFGGPGEGGVDAGEGLPSAGGRIG